MLLPLGVTALVLTACGAGVASSAPATKAGRNGDPQTVAATRKHAAQQRAAKLLREFVPPPGARRLQRVTGAQSMLAVSGLTRPAFGEVAQRHAFWQVGGSFGQAVAHVKTHSVAGLRLRSQARQAGARQNATLNFSLGKRLLAVTLVRLGGRTVIRVDAGAVWTYPRSPDTMLPAGVQTIDLSSERFSRHVADPGKVAQIVDWFNALEIVQPGVHVICPLVLTAPPLTFEFRSGSGALLAQAAAPSVGPSTQCSPIGFSIGGVKQTPLVGGDFVLRVERLLGVGSGSP